MTLFLHILRGLLFAGLLLTGASCGGGEEGSQQTTTSVWSLFSGHTDDEEIEAAVVSLKVTKQSFNVLSPWSSTRPQQVTGSGFLVAGGWVVTNAHVISDARHILLRRHGQERFYPAQVAFVAHDSDLALVRAIDEKGFVQDAKPLTLGRLPSLRSRVRTYGFPAGGRSISRTEGVVSRVEFVTYVHSGSDQHLAVQTDSAINPGNSGGPVMQDGKVVGVAFQANTALNDVGFFIPIQLVGRLLKDAQDGTYDGVPELGLHTSNLLNPVQRTFLGLDKKGGGVVVERVLTKSASQGLVVAGDVLLSINNHPIGATGSIDYLGHRMPFEQLIEERQINNIVRLKVLRQGKMEEVEITLSTWPYAAHMRHTYDKPLPYIIYSGLVFMPLNWDVMQSFGNSRMTPIHLVERYFHSLTTETDDNPPNATIVLRQVLPHSINQAYQSMQNHVVDLVNGYKITSLEQLALALEKPTNGFHVFTLQPGGRTLVLDVRQAQEAHVNILQTYGALRAVTPAKLLKQLQQQRTQAVKTPSIQLPSLTPDTDAPAPKANTAAPKTTTPQEAN